MSDSQLTTVLAVPDTFPSRMRVWDLIIPYMFVLYPLGSFIFRYGANMSFVYISSSVLYVLLAEKLLHSIRNGVKLRFPYYFIFYSLFVVYTVVTNLIFQDTYKEEGIARFIYGNDYLASAIALFLIENSRYSVNLIRILVKLMLLWLWIATGVSLLQTIDPLFAVNTTSEEIVDLLKGRYANRLYSIYTWTPLGEFGFGIVPIICLLHSMALYFEKKNYVVLVLGAIVSFLNLARWVILNYILIFFQDSFLDKKRLYLIFKYFVYLIVVFFLSYTVLSSVGVDLDPIIENRLLDSETASTRIIAWEVFQREFPKNPIWGTGGEYLESTIDLIAGRSSQIHVGYLALLYLYGIVGGSLFFLFMASVLNRMRKVAMHSRFWGAYYVFILYFVSNLTLVVFRLNFHGIILTLIFHKFFEQLMLSHYKAYQQEKIHQDVESVRVEM